MSEVATRTKTRADAWDLLTRYVSNENLRKHMLATEAAMRHYARHFNEDEDVWGMVGLLHDFDYEQHPSLDEHPFKGQDILAAEGFSEEVRAGILAHAPHTGAARDTNMKKAIFAVDELCGFIVAVALVKPSKSLTKVDVASVKKKLKRKDFAAAINRDEIVQGADELGIPLDEHIGHVISALQETAQELDLG